MPDGRRTSRFDILIAHKMRSLPPSEQSGGGNARGMNAKGAERLIHFPQHHLEFKDTMKHTALILMLAASALAASAQTPAKPAAPAATAAKPASTAAAAKPAAPVAKPAPSASPLIAPVIKTPDNKCGEDFCVPQLKGLQKPVFTMALRYQEIKVGDGPVAELNKLYKVHYTGYRAADGVKFDSSKDRPGPPLKDKDGKPVLGDDGKPKLDDPQPVPFPQGQGAFITGFDQGVVGMKIGGKRRIFIPWQIGLWDAQPFLIGLAIRESRPSPI